MASAGLSLSASTDANDSTNPLRGSHNSSASDREALSPLEQEVLDEYARLLGNLNNVSILFFGLIINVLAS